MDRLGPPSQGFEEPGWRPRGHVYSKCVVGVVGVQVGLGREREREREREVFLVDVDRLDELWI